MVWEAHCDRQRLSRGGFASVVRLSVAREEGEVVTPSGRSDSPSVLAYLASARFPLSPLLPVPDKPYGLCGR